MRARLHSRLLLATALAAVSLGAASCAVPLGPGYTIEKQQIRVRFTPEPEPRLRIEGSFQLKNTGNRPLSKLEMRLPGRRRFHYENATAQWDSDALVLRDSPDNPRNTMVTLGGPWKLSSRHTLHLAVEITPPREGETALSFSKDAFFLPAAGWSAELLPPGGLFAKGGTPPKLWELLVTVPDGFEIHTSGLQKKGQQKGGEMTILAEQRRQDPYPFVIAGRYSEAQIGKGKEKIRLWMRQKQESDLREASDALTRVIGAYDASFGERRKQSAETWIVQCPVPAACFTNLTPLTARLLGEEENERTTAEMISQDTMVVDLSSGAPRLAAAAAPSLAASWLGYGQNPGFFGQELPLSLLPAFAASLGREAAAGTESRSETIRNVLRLVPAETRPHQAEDGAVLRAKSFLFFYGLQDHYGHEMFRRAMEHMLYARRERGFELDDLIAAFEEEDPRRNAAEFVRNWMKHPGVPEEFRAHYEGTPAATAALSRLKATSELEPHKETRP